MHVIDKEYYTATKEDVLAFRKELYKLYEMICEYFNNNRNTFVDDIRTKFQELYKYVDGDGKAVKRAEKADDVEKTADAKVEDAANVDANAANVDANAADVVKVDAKAVEAVEAAVAAVAAKVVVDADAAKRADADERDFKRLEENMKNTGSELDIRGQLVQENKELQANTRGALSRRATPPEALSRGEQGVPQLREPSPQLREPSPQLREPSPQLREPPAQLREEQGAFGSIFPTNPFAETGKELIEARGKAVAAQAAQLKEQTEAQGKALAAQLKEQAQANVEAEIAKKKALVNNFLSPLTSLTKGANGAPPSPSGIFSQLAQKALKSPK